MTNIPSKKYDYYFAWTSDFKENTGEGRLARLFLKDFSKQNFTKVITFSQGLKYLISDNKIKIIEVNNVFINFKKFSFLIGILYSWIYFFKRSPFIYVNYLPLWNFLIYIFLSPCTKIGPITGSKIFNDNQKFRKYFFPFFYTLSLRIIELRFKKVVFATDNLKKFVKKNYRKNCYFNFCLKYLENLKYLYSNKKSIDFIIYNKIHKNKFNTFIKKVLFFLMLKRYNIHCFGDKIDVPGVINHGYLSNKEATNLIVKSKYMINSGENFYTFFLMECIKYRVNIIYNISTYPYEKLKLKNILGINYNNLHLSRIKIIDFVNKN
jgi:hypothetical protein